MCPAPQGNQLTIECSASASICLLNSSLTILFLPPVWLRRYIGLVPRPIRMTFADGMVSGMHHGTTNLMSKLFGPVIQQGYVVSDIEAAMQHWLARGIGPFFIETLRGYPAIVRGETVKVDLRAAFAYSGDQQIEVIQPEGDSRNIYTEFLQRVSEGGLHHLAVWVDSIADKLAELEAAGRSFRVVQQYGDRHAYLDSVEAPGVMVQLMAHNEMNDELFRVIRAGADSWDGVSHPIREIDWSSGRPVAPAL